MKTIQLTLITTLIFALGWNIFVHQDSSMYKREVELKLVAVNNFQHHRNKIFDLVDHDLNQSTR